MNSFRIICRTFIDWLAHSMRFLPKSAISTFLMSQLMAAVDILFPLYFLLLRFCLRGARSGRKFKCCLLVACHPEASAVCSPKDLGEPRAASRSVRRNKRAFGSLPYYIF